MTYDEMCKYYNSDKNGEHQVPVNPRRRNYIVKADITKNRYYVKDIDMSYEKEISKYCYGLLKEMYDSGRLHYFTSVCADMLYPETPLNVQPEITNVIFHDPATIVKWSDGTKTVVKCSELDTYDAEKGLAMAILKKKCGDDYYKEIREWTRGKSEHVNSSEPKEHKDTNAAKPKTRIDDPQVTSIMEIANDICKTLKTAIDALNGD